MQRCCKRHVTHAGASFRAKSQARTSHVTRYNIKHQRPHQLASGYILKDATNTPPLKGIEYPVKEPMPSLPDRGVGGASGLRVASHEEWDELL